MSAPVVCEPLAPLVPDQVPEAVHEVALVADQVSIELLPLAMVLGFAARLSAGAAALTDTVTDCVALPPVPEQTRTYVELVVRAPVACEPLTALLPDHAPEAVHEVALVDDHVKVDAAPLFMVLGEAARLTVGTAALTETVAV